MRVKEYENRPTTPGVEHEHQLESAGAAWRSGAGPAGIVEAMNAAMAGIDRWSRRLADCDPRAAISVAVALALACIGAIIARYDSLPAVLPVTRWTSSAKSPFIAVRIPVVNLLTTVGLAAIWTAFDRTGFPRAAGLALMAAAAVKSLGEALEILMLPDASRVLPALIAATIGTAILVVLTTSRSWLTQRRWRSARWTPRLATVAIGTLVGIVGLNVVAA